MAEDQRWVVQPKTIHPKRTHGTYCLLASLTPSKDQPVKVRLTSVAFKGVSDGKRIVSGSAVKIWDV